MIAKCVELSSVLPLHELLGELLESVVQLEFKHTHYFDVLLEALDCAVVVDLSLVGFAVNYSGRGRASLQVSSHFLQVGGNDVLESLDWPVTVLQALIG